MADNVSVQDSQFVMREPSEGSTKMVANDKDSEESGLMQMADDQSDVSGMMQAVVDEETSEQLIADLGTVTKAPNIRNH